MNHTYNYVFIIFLVCNGLIINNNFYIPLQNESIVFKKKKKIKY